MAIRLVVLRLWTCADNSTREDRRMMERTMCSPYYVSYPMHNVNIKRHVYGFVDVAFQPSYLELYKQL